VWFQQDGVPAHFAVATRDYLNEIFHNKWIGRRGSIEWPPRSPDLAPLDYFYWGYLKMKLDANHPQTIPELKEEIRRTINEISPQLCQNVIENFVKRMNVCKQSRGGHLSDIVFYI
ncbi:hypothetical protein G5I_05054, partial [Acromyrmex echinatior]